MADSATRQLIVDEAKRRSWRVEYIGARHYFCKIIHPDGRWELLHGSRPLKSSANGVVISQNKQLTLGFVGSLGYAVPESVMFENVAQARKFLDQHQRIVVKPADGMRSDGVSMDITESARLDEAIVHAQKFSDNVLLQRQITGKSYRLFVLDGSLIAAAERFAPEVVGDGERAVLELIEILNADPRRGKTNEKPLKKIDIEATRRYLGDKFQSIPAKGERVQVSPIESISAGGQAANVTALVHPSWRAIAEQIAQTLRLFVCGVDLLCPDIAEPAADNYLPLLEINSIPGLKSHHYPTAGGEPIDIASKLLDRLFC